MTSAFVSPLRYPGGKRKLANFVKLVCATNDLLDGEYAEPYAGGASIALSLLFDEYAQYIHINDIDRALYAFWFSVLNCTESLCRLIQDTPVNMAEWHKQKAIQEKPEASLLELGFSTFFLNRTNHSGVIRGGVIGGKRQTGKWKLDARFNKPDLTKRIRRIARYRGRILLYNQDASDFIQDTVPCMPQSTLIYLDPPYYVKGGQLLYTNFYEPDDHRHIAELLTNTERLWMLSYDSVPETRALYRDFRHVDYHLSYSAQDRYKGSETMFFCEGLHIPDVPDPAKLKRQELARYLI